MKILTLLLLFLGLAFYGFSQTEVDEKLAVQFYQDGDYQKAADLFEKIYRKKPNPYYYTYYIESLFALKDFKSAEKFVKEMQRFYPNDQKYLVELGFVYSVDNQEKKAVKQYENSIKQLQSDPQQYIDLANAFRNRNLNDYALKTLLKGKKEIKDPPMNFELAEFYKFTGDYNAMIAEYLSLVEIDEKYLPSIQSKLQLIIADERNEKIAEALRFELLSKVNAHPNKTIYVELLYWFSLQRKEFKIALVQAKALDRQFAESGNRVYQLGIILINNESYALAIDAFTYLMTNYKSNPELYKQSRMYVLNASFKELQNKKNPNISEVKRLVNDYYTVLAEYGKSESTVPLMMDLSDLEAFNLQNFDGAIKILEEVLSMGRVNPQTKAAAKLKLGDVLLFSGSRWDANILYQQVEKEFKFDAIGFEAKFKIAKFYYFVGEMEWAKVQLDVLKAATSKLIANDAMELSLLITENIDPDSSYTTLKTFAQSDLFIYQKQYLKALDSLNYLSEEKKSHSLQDHILMRKATVYMALGNDSLAIFNWKTLIQSLPQSTQADNATIELARYYDSKNQIDLANVYYQKILLEYQGSLFTLEARKRYRELKQLN